MKKLPELFENNRRWAEKINRDNPGFFRKLSEGQNPDYLWIGCSDSRVPANEITGLPPGELFVHRNVANVVVHSDLNAQSVLQFAVEALGVNHILVCGHYGCGGVKAAMESGSPGLIDNWLGHLRDLFDEWSENVDEAPSPEEKLNRYCELNVRAQVMNVCHSPVVQKAWKQERELSVHGWIYDLRNGLLKDLDLCISSAEETGDIYRL